MHDQRVQCFFFINTKQYFSDEGRQQVKCYQNKIEHVKIQVFQKMWNTERLNHENENTEWELTYDAPGNNQHLGRTPEQSTIMTHKRATQHALPPP